MLMLLCPRPFQFFFGESILEDLFWDVPINYASKNGNANAFFFGVTGKAVGIETSIELHNQIKKRGKVMITCCHLGSY